MADSTNTRSSRQFININGLKGNLVRDPKGPFQANGGRKYSVVSLACNLDDKTCWFVKIMAFGPAADTLSKLGKGDFIQLQRATFNPSQIQNPYQGSDGVEYQPQDTVFLNSYTDDTGATIVPLKVIRRYSPTKPTESSQVEMPIDEETEAQVAQTITTV